MSHEIGYYFLLTQMLFFFTRLDCGYPRQQKGLVERIFLNGNHRAGRIGKYSAFAEGLHAQSWKAALFHSPARTQCGLVFGT